MRELVLVRHGETEWSASGKHTSRSDIGLTERGRTQAEAVRAFLAGRQFARVFTSPLARAQTTCALAGLGERAETRDELREWDYGVYEGRTTAEIREDIAGWSVWTHPLVDGETADHVGARADRLIAEIEPIDGDVICFGHAHNLRILTARWCQLPAVEGRRFALDPASVSVLAYERENRVVGSWNQAP